MVRKRRKKKDLPSKSELIQFYVTDKKSMQKIGSLFHVGAPKIKNLLIEYDIPVQKRGAWGLGQTKETNSSIMKISKSKMGHTVPKLTRQKISKTLTGKPSLKKGKPMSQTAYENVKKSGSWFKKGNKPVHTFEKGRTSEFKGQTKETNPAIMKGSITRTGKTRTDEQKNTMSMAGIQKFIDHPEIKEKISIARSKQKFPYKDTKIELHVQSILEENNIIFKKHKNFKLSKSNHQADITIEPDKVIEVNGDYWHFNPKKYDGESIQKLRGIEIQVKEKWAYDKYLIDEMESQGYKVLVVWESELKNELDKTTKKILKFAKS